MKKIDKKTRKISSREAAETAIRLSKEENVNWVTGKITETERESFPFQTDELEINLLIEARMQLLRAARTMDLCSAGAEIKKDNPSILGCDMLADRIDNYLKQSPEAIKLMDNLGIKI